MDRLTRKELKQDKFAREVGHTFEFLTEHKRQLIRYGVAALAVVLLAVGWWYYSASQRAARQAELRKVIDLMGASIGAQTSPGEVVFPNTSEKDKAIAKALTDLATKYAGTEEGAAGRYLLGTTAADQGKLDDAAKSLSEAAKSGNSEYASLAQFALAQVYFAQGKTAEAERLLRALIAKPTLMVSKSQATVALAQGLAASKPQEARKLLEPLRSQQGVVGSVAASALENLGPAK